MRTTLSIRAVAVFCVAVSLSACAAAAGPWPAHDGSFDLKRKAADRSSVCPVVFTNDTGDLIEAGYVSLGVESSVGMIPSGHSLEVAVSCRQDRIEAFAVADQGLTGGTVRYRKRARLNLAQVTRLEITAADRVRR
jgi:hypothetical protein